MADVINAITRMKSLGSRPDWLKNMSDEELQANIQQLEAQQKNSRANAVQDTLQNVGNVFLQRGGLQPVQRTRGNDLNDFIVRETLKQRLREKPQANYSEESLPPGLWRDRTSGKIYKVPIEEVQENVGEQPLESNPQATPLKTTVPEGFWRDEATGKVYRLPAKTPDKTIPTGAVPEGFWRDEATGKVYKITKNNKETPGNIAADKKMSQMKIEATNLSNEAKGMIDAAWTTADKLIPSANTPKEAESAGVGRKAGSATIFGVRPQRLLGVSDENAITYQQFLDGTVSMMIRSLGEKGVLNSQDIKRAYNLMPGFSDTTKQRTTKKEELNNFLNSRIQSYTQKKGQEVIPTQTAGGSTPSFTNEQEAEASGYKGEVMIGGRRAIIN
ncbi:MAG: hypothetical protein ABFC84_16660 [Veillonellales bacterium]